jgi:hypothetical protein
MPSVSATGGLSWEGDLLHVGGVTLHAADELEGEHPLATLALGKSRWLIETILRACEPLRPRRILELGAHEGGSAVLWHEIFAPEKLVTIDLAPGPGPPALGDYARLRPYWGVDQADGKRLLEIVEAEFDGPLDLVIDDASHLSSRSSSPCSGRAACT